MSAEKPVATAHVRQVEAITLPSVEPARIDAAPPEFASADPRELRVDESYQRTLSDRSIRLIRKIVTEWDWRAFKPPVCARIDGALHIIDGQHTAIAAATHGGFDQIPVMIITASETGHRADAFVRHNRDRIHVTPTQMHNAMIAAGDETALTINQVCDRAGVTVLRNAPASGRFRSGETIAVTSIRAVINRRFAMGARKVLECCRQTGMAPISAALIRAVECLMYDPEYRGEIEPERIVRVCKAMPDTLMDEAKRFAAERKVPVWRALASVIYMNRRKRAHD